MRVLSILVLAFVALSNALVLPMGAASPGMAVSPQRCDVSMTAKTKATRVNIRNRAYNRKYRSEMRTRIKGVLEAIEGADYAEAGSKLSAAMSIIDKNVKRGIVHRNTAARTKSRLTLRVKKLEPAQ